MKNPIASPTGAPQLLKSLNPAKAEGKVQTPVSAAIKPAVGRGVFAASSSSSGIASPLTEQSRSGVPGSIMDVTGTLAIDYTVIKNWNLTDNNSQTVEIIIP